jgi:alanine racemase
MSHLACADEPLHPMNAAQLAAFNAMSFALPARRKALSATGGILLGAPFHFNLTRPGIGLYGGAPFADAKPVVQLDLPVIQTRDVLPGEAVGYGATWLATRPSKIATVSGGYADGILRAAKGFSLYAGATPCPVVGRISMDLITVDVTDLKEIPPRLSLLNSTQTVDVLAQKAGTIGYEILTSLGSRYQRRYTGG